MRHPPIGEFNLGALVGVIVGATGGLFAVGLPPAILTHNPAMVFKYPILGLISFIICGLFAWFLGGQVGPRLGEKFYSQHAEILGGVFAGLVPMAGIVMWSWYMVTH